MNLPNGGSAERPTQLPKPWRDRKQKHFRTSRRDNFLCFSIDSGAPQKITSYIEDKMGGRRHGEELPPKITDCIEDEMGGRRGGKWGEGDGYLLLQRLT